MKQIQQSPVDSFLFLLSGKRLLLIDPSKKGMRLRESPMRKRNRKELEARNRKPLKAGRNLIQDKFSGGIIENTLARQSYFPGRQELVR
jgi:hypothetical protein